MTVVHMYQRLKRACDGKFKRIGNIRRNNETVLIPACLYLILAIKTRNTCRRRQWGVTRRMHLLTQYSSLMHADSSVSP